MLLLPLTVSEKKYPVLHGLKEQQNLLMCYGKSLKNATKRGNFDHVQSFKTLDCVVYYDFNDRSVT